MSTPQPTEIDNQEQRLKLAEIEAITLRNFYTLAREKVMAAVLKKRDFEFCRDEQGLVSSAEDGDLQADIKRELNYTRGVFERAKEALFEVEEEICELRKNLRTMKKRASKG